eukprot:TRINITY_DN54520_c0_g1_i2.p1 TRINITY_DN54520_c0_g1~~TRINITY_DN54520_c0_g1_i2.p1  ORF type:complete len:106 (+),score=3.79 TRINITY_DN54520_c0_g1_i2:173-490(+)
MLRSLVGSEMCIRDSCREVLVDAVVRLNRRRYESRGDHSLPVHARIPTAGELNHQLLLKSALVIYGSFTRGIQGCSRIHTAPPKERWIRGDLNTFSLGGGRSWSL